MLTVNLYSKPGFAYPRRKFLKLVKSICKRFRVNSATINILITDNRQIRSFNKKFHHRNAVTDCLSFDLSESHLTAEHAETAEKKVTLNGCSYAARHGYVKRMTIDETNSAIERRNTLPVTSAVSRTFDIIVNAQKAKLEAKKRGHSPQAELALYIIHALLHNLGFDDNTAKKAKLMHQTEDEILQQQDFGKVYDSHSR